MSKGNIGVAVRLGTGQIVGRHLDGMQSETFPGRASARREGNRGFVLGPIRRIGRRVDIQKVGSDRDDRPRNRRVPSSAAGDRRSEKSVDEIQTLGPSASHRKRVRNRSCV